MLTNFIPDVNQILLVALQFIIATVLGFVMRWLKTRTTSEQRDVLHRVATEAYAFVKAVYVEHDGPTKLAAAMAYLSSRLKARGINFTTDEMRAAIEAARLAYKSATTQPAAADPVVQVVEKLVPAPLAPEVEQLIAAAKALAPAAAPQA